MLVSYILLVNLVSIYYYQQQQYLNLCNLLYERFSVAVLGKFCKGSKNSRFFFFIVFSSVYQLFLSIFFSMQSQNEWISSIISVSKSEWSQGCHQCQKPSHSSYTTNTVCVQQISIKGMDNAISIMLLHCKFITLLWLTWCQLSHVRILRSILFLSGFRNNLLQVLEGPTILLGKCMITSLLQNVAKVCSLACQDELLLISILFVVSFSVVERIKEGFTVFSEGRKMYVLLYV